MDKKANLSPNEIRDSILPSRDLQCIWVSAGLLSYKLCKYDFECERCPLDMELRNVSFSPSSGPLSSKEKKNDSFLRDDPSLFRIKESLFYHPGHTWIKVERADQVRVGLDHFLGTLIGKVNVVILPLAGTRGIRGENLCCLILEEGILQTVFPISGRILSVNPKLKDYPELACSDPLGEGFLLTLRPKNLQRDQKYLLTGEVACEWYRKEWERFKEIVVSEIHPGQEKLGVTMQDGGIALNDIRRFIHPERFAQLVNAFLRRGERSFFRAKSKREPELPREME